MKKLLLFLFIPFISFGQTYEELMSINSIDMFKKVVIENNYEPYKQDDKIAFYGFNIVKDSKEDSMSKGFVYFKKQYVFILNVYKEISFLGVKTPRENTEYDLIVDKIKNKCTYYKIMEGPSGDDFVTYSCPESSYKGKIGFAINEGWGVIINFPEE